MHWFTLNPNVVWHYLTLCCPLLLNITSCTSCHFHLFHPPFMSSCLQEWPKERWCRQFSEATGCPAPTAAPLSYTKSWRPAGRCDLKTDPPLNTCRASWMTFTPPQRTNTSTNHRQTHSIILNTFCTYYSLKKTCIYTGLIVYLTL